MGKTLEEQGEQVLQAMQKTWIEGHSISRLLSEMTRINSQVQALRRARGTGVPPIPYSDER